MPSNESLLKLSRRQALAALAGPALARLCAQQGRRPNFIIIFTDDQGYGDLGCYGSPNIRTPNIDRMAGEGIRFTSLCVQAFCGPSRSALMTGCYPPRTSTSFNHTPKAKTGLNPQETTIASALKPMGYTNMIVGKWHLGDHPNFLPMRYGFDKFYGLPYSNDMWPYHPLTFPGENEHPRLVAARQRAEYTGYAGKGTHYPKGGGFPDLPLMSNEQVLEINPDLTKLTSTYTQQAVNFIRENRSRPFFLYLAHNMPHVPLFPGKEYKGKSRRGLYGDAVEEVDWSVGQVMKTLKELNLEQDTMIFFASDNGPWLEYGVDGGSAGPLRLGKGTHWEGGFRVPGIFRWPGHIPAGQVSSELVASIDVLPTIARLAGARLPQDRVIDGKDIWPLLKGEAGARTPHDAFYYFRGSPPGKPNLAAVRSGKWKLHFKMEEGKLTPIALYDLEEDVGELNDRLGLNGELARKMTEGAQQFYDKLLTEIRPLGRLPG